MYYEMMSGSQTSLLPWTSTRWMQLAAICILNAINNSASRVPTRSRRDPARKHEDLGLAVYPIPLRTETKKSKHSLFFPFAASSITVRFYVYYTMQPNSTLVASDAYGASHPSSVNYFGLL